MSPVYVVGVLRESDNAERFYRVNASAPEDALQLAFAMDGAYGPNEIPWTIQDETGTLDLAKMYCRIVEDDGCVRGFATLEMAIEESKARNLDTLNELG